MRRPVKNEKLNARPKLCEDNWNYYTTRESLVHALSINLILLVTRDTNKKAEPSN